MKTATQLILQIVQGQTFFVKESSQVAYGNDFVQFPDEKDLLRAHLLVELIERYRYSPERILVALYLPVKNNGVDYAEIDMVVQDSSHNPFILCAVEPPQTFEEKFDDTMRKLFAMSVFMREKVSPHFLMYYTRWYEDRDATRKTRQIIVDSLRYQTFSEWNSAGRPTETDLPQNQP